jgi:uncharacterized protein YbjQ (UPF0145 family)
VLDLIIFLVLLGLGYFIGQWNERRHFASIRLRERQYAKVLAFATKYPPEIARPQACVLVAGCVVVGSDYFKQFVAGLKSLIGGRLTSYESLLDRARREAVLRMKEQALLTGSTLVVNVKFETTNIGGVGQALPIIQMIAYGTALKPLDVLSSPGAPAR